MGESGLKDYVSVLAKAYAMYSCTSRCNTFPGNLYVPMNLLAFPGKQMGNIGPVLLSQKERSAAEFNESRKTTPPRGPGFCLCSLSKEHSIPRREIIGKIFSFWPMYLTGADFLRPRLS